MAEVTGQFQDLIEQINTVLDAETVLYKINYKIDSVVQSGMTIKAFCPIHKETMIRSLMVDPNKRRFRCNYANCAGNRGGTFFELYCLAMDLSEEEGVRTLAAEMGFEVDPSLTQNDSASDEKGEDSAIPTFSSQSADVSDASQADGFEEDLIEYVTGGEIAGETDQTQKTGTEDDVSATEFSVQDFDSCYAEAVKTFESNKYIRAREFFEQALSLAEAGEKQIQCKMMLARTWIQLRKTDEALELLQQASEAPDVSENMQKEIIYRTAEAHERAGRNSKAAEILESLNSQFGSYRDSDSRIVRLREKDSQSDGGTRRDRRISFI